MAAPTVTNQHLPILYVSMQCRWSDGSVRLCPCYIMIALHRSPYDESKRAPINFPLETTDNELIGFNKHSSCIMGFLSHLLTRISKISYCQIFNLIVTFYVDYDHSDCLPQLWYRSHQAGRCCLYDHTFLFHHSVSTIYCSIWHLNWICEFDESLR